MSIKKVENNYKDFPYNLLTEYIIKGYNLCPEMEYEIANIPARKLLSSRRIDIMAKWLLIEAEERGLLMDPYIELYDAHIAAFSMGTYTEPGSEYKNSIEKYLTEFYEIRKDIKYNGFDELKSIIPAGNEYEIIDGSHRVASAAYFDKDVKVIRFPSISRRFDADFFIKRGLEEKYIDKMVNKYVLLKENVHAAILWPAAKDENLREDAIKILKQADIEIIYSKDLKLKFDAIKLLVRQVYDGQSWIGTYNDGYAGASYKAEKCFDTNGITKVVFFECNDDKLIIEVKKKIRDIFGIENHSIHITDTREEANDIANILLNQNSLHFLNHAKPDVYKETTKRIILFRNWLKKMNYNKDEFLIDSATVMALYGLRETNDLDFLSINGTELCDVEGIDNHETQLKYYSINKQDLIYNSNYYFYYFGIKIISPRELINMKSNRRELKDLKDIEVLKNMIGELE